MNTILYKTAEEASSDDYADHDVSIRNNILNLLYISRRRDVSNPGLGIYEILKLIECPEQHLEFHLWYLSEKKWIETTPTGKLAITVYGIDTITDKKINLRDKQLLTYRNQNNED